LLSAWKFNYRFQYCLAHIFDNCFRRYKSHNH